MEDVREIVIASIVWNAERVYRIVKVLQDSNKGSQKLGKGLRTLHDLRATEFHVTGNASREHRVQNEHHVVE